MLIKIYAEEKTDWLESFELSESTQDRFQMFKYSECLLYSQAAQFVKKMPQMTYALS